MKRIVHVITTLNPFGAERLLMDLTAHIDKSRFESMVVCFRSPVLLPEFKRRNIPCVCLEYGKGDPRILIALIKLIRQFCPDIVHTHLFEADLFGTLSAQLAGGHQIIGSRHSLDPFKTRFYFRPFNAYLSRSAKYLIVVSEAVRDFCINYEKAKASQCIVIPNCIDLEKFSQKSAMPHQVLLDKQRNILLGVVGRLAKQKGHVILFKALVIVLKHNPNVKLIIVGDGSLRGELEKTATTLGLNGNVQFLGRCADVAVILKDLDLFVLPSLNEGFGISILEAMAVGLPIVASRTGGITEIIEDGKNGRLVDPGNPEMLATAILDMINNLPCAEKMGQYNCEVVRERFNIRQYTQRIESLYDQCQQA